VLAYDGRELDVDAKSGKVRSRWGGRTMRHPVTGEDVPDPSDQVPIYRYINPRPAVWQEADYIVSNPPFIGNARMREALGDGYTETLRKVYPDVPDTVDFVMYWWQKAAEIVRNSKVNRFGFITTNSIRQPRLRSVIQSQLVQKNPLQLFFAVPDHPWAEEGAAVRISMTGAELENSKTIITIPQLGILVSEGEGDTPEDRAIQVKVDFRNVGKIFSNLQAGADITKAQILSSTKELASKGFEVGSSGFIINENIKNNLEQNVVHPFVTGRDLAQISENRYAIDVNHLSDEELSLCYSKTYSNPK
jgi:hypothetical protein